MPTEVFLPVGLNKGTWVSTRLIVTSAEIYGADGNQKAGEVRNIGRIALGGDEETPRVRLLVSSSRLYAYLSSYMTGQVFSAVLITNRVTCNQSM